MKTLITIVSFALLLGCNAKKDGKTELTTNAISEEIKLDSLGLEKLFADSTLKVVNASDIKELTKNLADTSLFAGLGEGFLRLDSIKKAGAYENYLSHLDIGMYKDIKTVSYKDVDLGDGNTLKIWGFDYQTYEACPYANGKVILVSSFKDGKNVGCVPLAYFHNWADAPFYDSYKTNSVLDKNGNLTVKETKNSGGMDEKEKEYQSTSTSKYQSKLVDGVFK
ncbi:hypothetical protein EGI26_11720 [Lacihabitans sp. CCS-44]|uniref:hypothetical protein n=1 Tax=Lacihabitans sp. CCS-44 TaxID=2487331 RepID=UPI0020CCDBD9|nr:hypothetical protein [Lacihabitans sp. CCS-44]MCP9755824.1 hypothetical protein [Lacihabitans sp. CCS-44]